MRYRRIDDFSCPAYECCTACPKQCKVNRNNGETGFCGETAELRIAWAGLHFGEEPPVTGLGGSGTVFITGCNLGCSFCQNVQISQQGTGKAVSRSEFVRICLYLQENGAENINIVTGSHAIPALAQGLRAAKAQGLHIPVLWNSSAYETAEALALLDGIVDGWLPDLKTLNPHTADTLFHARNYPEYAKTAIKTIITLSPTVIDYDTGQDYPHGFFRSGVIVRHLALPDHGADSRAVLEWFARNAKKNALLSLMTQYTPVCSGKQYTPCPNRFLTESEDTSLRAMLSELSIEDGFFQELIEDKSWLPDFNRIQTFSSSLSKPLWHWSRGFIR